MILKKRLATAAVLGIAACATILAAASLGSSVRADDTPAPAPGAERLYGGSLLQAAAARDLYASLALLRAGAALYETDEAGRTPLL
ncbi:MAG TPA: hypothetical protein P5069_08670, partial [Candidatus Hydrogenedentes bacterium]|nr:hypothetical protein [Candidatus Hydrogenedentota bacterium]